jgi:23S rRNA (guanine2445-N2)-methyltransferase / 23S rRNA (guanine2069-N7)-methyltransferase
MSLDAWSPSAVDFIATCTFGLEAVVVRELEQLGLDAVPVGTGRVAFRVEPGEYRLDAYRGLIDANLWLRAADRVLIRVGSMDVGGGDAGFDQLFHGVKALPWERWIAQSAAFPVSGRCVRSAITSEPALQRATKRAIVERLSHAYQVGGVPGALPETGPEVQVEVALVNNHATLTIDSSGAGLHRRGYRVGGVAGLAAGDGGRGAGEAAIRETLAAGLVLLSVWRPGASPRRPMVDPFCGSGTIAIEAALLARGIAPGLNRADGFAAERWLKPRPAARAESDTADSSDAELLIPAELWASARAEARAAIVPDRLDPPIHASDIDEQAISLARRNAIAAGVERDIHFVKRDVRDITSKLEHGVIITNPPYGVRLGDEREIESLYRALPVVFRSLPTWTFHILTGRLDLERLFGQDATRRRKLYNAKIECCYYTFLGPKPPRPARVEPELDATAPEPAGDDLEEASSEPAEARAATNAASPAPTFGGLRTRDVQEAGDFARCLANNLRHLRKYPARGVNAYRVYERDVPDVPLIVDRIIATTGEFFHASEYEREHSRTAAQQADWFDLMRRTIAETAGVPIEHVVMKQKHRQRGLSQHEKQAEVGRVVHVVEGEEKSAAGGGPALTFELNLTDYIDTGLFLDHRLTRQMVRAEARGKRFLNLFCYTSSFSVYAASGGASSTTSVDLSNTYLDWSARNLERNGFASVGGAHKLIRADALAFLREHAPRRNPGEGYDLVVVDPPTFSNSKKTEQDWVVQDDHVELLGLLAPLLSPGAVVYFSNNHRKFKLAVDQVTASGFRVQDISRRTVPPEFRNKRIHQCWRMTFAGLGGEHGSGDESREAHSPEARSSAKLRRS